MALRRRGPRGGSQREQTACRQRDTRGGGQGRRKLRTSGSRHIELNRQRDPFRGATGEEAESRGDGGMEIAGQAKHGLEGGSSSLPRLWPLGSDPARSRAGARCKSCPRGREIMASCTRCSNQLASAEDRGCESLWLISKRLFSLVDALTPTNRVVPISPGGSEMSRPGDPHSERRLLSTCGKCLEERKKSRSRGRGIFLLVVDD